MQKLRVWWNEAPPVLPSRQQQPMTLDHLQSVISQDRTELEKLAPSPEERVVEEIGRVEGVQFVELQRPLPATMIELLTLGGRVRAMAREQALIAGGSIILMSLAIALLAVST